MKHSIKLLSAACALALGFSACDKSDSDGFHVSKDYLNPSPTITINGMGDGGDKLLVKSNCAWYVEVREDSEWLTLSKNHGDGNDEITVTATPNPNVRDPRVGKIAFFSQSQAAYVAVEVTVTQQVRSAFLTVDPASVTLPTAEEQDFEVLISTNVEQWRITTPDWLESMEGGGTAESRNARFWVQENTSVNERIGQIRFWNNNDELLATCEVKQPGSQAVLDIVGLVDNKMTFNCDASTSTFVIASDQTWSIIPPADQWVSIAPVAGTGLQTGESVAVSVLANETTNTRTTTMRIQHTKNPSINRTVTIEQQPYQATLGVENLAQLSAKGATYTLGVSGNQSWTALVDNAGQSWCKIRLDAPGSTDAPYIINAPALSKVLVTVDDNKTDEARSTTITFSTTTGLSATCTVTQNSNSTFTVSPVTITNVTASTVSVSLSYYYPGHKVINYGIIWSQTDPNVDFESGSEGYYYEEEATDPESDTLDITIGSLSPNTVYYLRGYAETETEIVYSPQTTMITTLNNSQTRPGEGDNPTPF